MPHLHLRSIRSGFSLIELLTVIGIFSLLLALLLPAVLTSREAARRVHCKSNLHQIMLAQHQYLSIHGVFPDINGHFHLRIADLIESPDPDRFSKSSLYMCPTDAMTTGEIRTGNFCSYFGNTGLKREGYAGRGDGFSGGYRTSLTEWTVVYISDADIKDGLSNTAAVSERLALPSFHVNDVDWSDYPHLWNRLILLTETPRDDLTAMADDCEFHAGSPRVRQYQAIRYNHILPPNNNSCTNGRPFDSNLNFPLSARSLHPGGVNVAMADSSVRFVSENISRDIWWAAGTRRGGETLSLGDE
ncbi:DUF1559 domain-containing protein [Rubinisphaera sp.]|uniref:DUF1559 family PulG-like putative transporter n=1 Tax=Rubinisphaera sp. TaxID=2024857 RepID=UPI0025E974E0|nr:DUF1559 domain-containing protein [Rubinisphaera sp.]